MQAQGTLQLVETATDAASECSQAHSSQLELGKVQVAAKLLLGKLSFS